jgi:hypothetical protein
MNHPWPDAAAGKKPHQKKIISVGIAVNLPKDTGNLIPCHIEFMTDVFSAHISNMAFIQWVGLEWQITPHKHGVLALGDTIRAAIFVTDGEKVKTGGIKMV